MIERPEVVLAPGAIFPREASVDHELEVGAMTSP